MKNNIFKAFIGILLISCTNPVPRNPIVIKSGSYMEQSVSLNKLLIESEENSFKNFIKSDSINTYLASPLGFWYTHTYKSTVIYFPKFGDKVEYTNEILDLNNTKIYSFEEIGKQSYAIDQQEIIEGLRDGLKIMNEGDEVTFLFPSHKLYGYIGDKNKIDINQPLIYKVQLIKIIKKNESN